MSERPIEDKVSHRYEVKFVCFETDLPRLHNWLSTNTAHFDIAHPDRHINNIYYDSFDYECVRSNLTGIGRRYKSRLRWYGLDGEAQNLWLELKIKNGSVGHKQVFKLPGRNVFDCRLDDLSRELCREVPPQVAQMSTHFRHPVLRNLYRRTYYVSGDGRVRLTIDRGQQFNDPAGSRFIAEKRGRHRIPHCVIELKADRSAYEYLSVITRDIPLRVGRNSKYLMGVSNLMHIPYI